MIQNYFNKKYLVEGFKFKISSINALFQSVFERAALVFLTTVYRFYGIVKNNSYFG